jgi:hypothetical protein
METWQRGKIDFWAVYCSGLSTAYLIPVDIVPDGSEGSLHIKENNYRNQHIYKFAKDYELERTIGRLA